MKKDAAYWSDLLDELFDEPDMTLRRAFQMLRDLGASEDDLLSVLLVLWEER